jgi:hypothetical protein
MDCGDTVVKNGGYGNTAKEVRLRLRMKALGISIFEPSPAEAIAMAEDARRADRQNGHAVADKAAHVS